METRYVAHRCALLRSHCIAVSLRTGGCMTHMSITGLTLYPSWRVLQDQQWNIYHLVVLRRKILQCLWDILAACLQWSKLSRVREVIIYIVTLLTWSLLQFCPGQTSIWTWVRSQCSAEIFLKKQSACICPVLKDNFGWGESGSKPFYYIRTPVVGVCSLHLDGLPCSCG